MDETQELRVVTVSEFAGTYPDVPLAPDIDLEAIRQDDPDPFFVTLPVCRVGAKSVNGLTYGLEANKQIAEQINLKKPEGGLGHIPAAEEAYRYDLPAWRAVGAQVIEDTTWAKFYVPPSRGDVREHMRLAKRTNARAGVSLWGRANINKAGEVITVDVKRVDVADPERTGLPVANLPIITREMADPARKEEVDMTEEIRIAEMQATIDRLQPLETRMAEMAGILGIDKPEEYGLIPQRVREMAAELTTRRHADQVSLVHAVVNEKVVEELRSVVIAHMGAEDSWTGDRTAIEAQVTTILAKPENIKLAEMVLKGRSGGNITLPGDDKGKDAPKDIVKQGEEDANRLGMSRRR